MQNKKILITGGCGFIGSSLAIAIKQKYPRYHVVSFDNLRRRGSELNIARLTKAGVLFIHGDIRNKEDFQQVGPVDLVIEASAEPSVTSGLEEGLDYLINTNLVGTINCLDYGTKYNANFIFLSTSRVYPISQIENINVIESDSRFELSEKQVTEGVTVEGISENFPLEGARSFYGATKLASELLIREYREFKGIKTVINRCGVVSGPYQMGKVDQGVVVLWVARHYWKNKLGYFGYGGTGKQVRDVLHVHDLFRLIDEQMHNMTKYDGQLFNVGGGKKCSVSLQELTAICQEVTGNKIKIEKVNKNRTADIRTYISDNKKITSLSGWRPSATPKKIVQDIYNWIKQNEDQLFEILN